MCIGIQHLTGFFVHFHFIQEFFNLSRLVLKLVAICDDGIEILNKLLIFLDFPVIVFLAPVTDQLFLDLYFISVFVFYDTLPDYRLYLEGLFFVPFIASFVKYPLPDILCTFLCAFGKNVAVSLFEYVGNVFPIVQTTVRNNDDFAETAWCLCSF